MAGVSVNISGMEAVLSNLSALTGNVKGKVQPVIEKALQATYDDSQNDVPVLSGDLKASGAIEIGDLQGSVSYGTNHCLFVELGTVKMAAQPYLVPNFTSAVSQMQDDLKGIV